MLSSEFVDAACAVILAVAARLPALAVDGKGQVASGFATRASVAILHLAIGER